ncbi:MAG: class I SAM-dependent methyltransferase [Undibacterium sp.]|nr:class I SAM-dependent methyltransferase [Opitutaceae bacterium]
MEVPDYIRSYEKLLDDLVAQHGREEAMSLIVGGQYRAIGLLESSALLTHGLRPEHSVVDVGCGSGRLAVALNPFLTGKFYGTDVLEKALDYAREKCARPDWEFIRTLDAVIPVEDGCADYVCFFSVFTHLLDEDIYRFLVEARRVAKSGGTIMFSYLDFEVPSHWPVFESTMANRNPNRVLNKFISKPAIIKWSDQLGLTVERLYEGFEPWINLTESFRYSDGREARGTVEFGQSMAILRTR